LSDAVFHIPPESDPGHVYHLFPVLTSQRAALQAHLSAAGIETLIHYPVPIPRQPALSLCQPAECPVAERICAEVLSLPLYPSLSEPGVARVVEAARSFPG
jgi:dTDP-4-amino-4,6-dideoxygalactose transaminase